MFKLNLKEFDLNIFIGLRAYNFFNDEPKTLTDKILVILCCHNEIHNITVFVANVKMLCK